MPPTYYDLIPSREAVVETTEVEEEEPKKKIDAGRILTPADFERLDELREQKERQGWAFGWAFANLLCLFLVFLPKTTDVPRFGI